MITTGARWTAVAALAGGALLMGGCTDDASDGPGEPSKSQPSETPTASSTAPAPLPSEASERSAEGAAAFVRHWFDLVNHGFQTGNPAPMLSIADGDCSACKDLQGKIEDLHGSGRHVRGQALSLDNVVAPAPTGETLIVAAAYRTAEHELVGVDGSVVSVPSDAPTTAGVVLAWQTQQWLLVDLGTS